MRLLCMKWGAYLCWQSSRCSSARRSIVCNALSRSSTTAACGSGTITPCEREVCEHFQRSRCEAVCETVVDFGRCRRHVLLCAFARRAGRDWHHHRRGKRRLSRRLARVTIIVTVFRSRPSFRSRSLVPNRGRGPRQRYVSDRRSASRICPHISSSRFLLTRARHGAASFRRRRTVCKGTSSMSRLAGGRN